MVEILMYREILGIIMYHQVEQNYSHATQSVFVTLVSSLWMKLKARSFTGQKGII